VRARGCRWDAGWGCPAASGQHFLKLCAELDVVCDFGVDRHCRTLEFREVLSWACVELCYVDSVSGSGGGVFNSFFYVFPAFFQLAYVNVSRIFTFFVAQIYDDTGDIMRVTLNGPLNFGSNFAALCCVLSDSSFLTATVSPIFGLHCRRCRS